MAIQSAIHTHSRQFHQPPGNNICQKHHYNGGNNISHKAITPAKNKQNKTVAITSAAWQ